MSAFQLSSYQRRAWERVVDVCVNKVRKYNTKFSRRTSVRVTRSVREWMRDETTKSREEERKKEID